MQLPDRGEVVDGRYQVMSFLGGGGFSVVYLGRDVESGQIVALKIMMLDTVDEEKWELARLRFAREMHVCHNLRHPNIVGLVSSGQFREHQLYAAFDFMDGIELGQLLKQQGALSAGETQHFMMQVLSALASAHKRGVVHRDLKPDNIMIVQGRGRRNAVVMDFGISSVLMEARDDNFVKVTKTGTLIGTPHYMAPEQIQGELTPQTDLYAWGLIFLECLTGERAVKARTAYGALSEQLAREPIEIPPVLMIHPFGPIIERAVCKETETRLKTAAEALRWLESAIPEPLL